MSAERLWRVRKDHQTVEARLVCDLNCPTSEVDVHFFFNGELIYGRRWRERDAAVVDARARLSELLRSGWATHW